MKKITAILLTLLILTGCGSNQGQTGTTGETVEDVGVKGEYVQITADEAKELMDTQESYILLDVRTQEEYESSHIPGAILIPDFQVEERAERELPDKEQMILVYCRSGNRSKTASQILANMGYTNVKEFGGIKDWPYETE